MKALKYILFGLGAIVAILLIVAAVTPTEYHVERSVEINAPQDVVMAQLKSQKSFNEHWSPWMKMDPEAKITYSGNDGEVGSAYEWEGEEVGKGRMEITAVSDNSVATKLHFMEPMDAECTGSYECEPAEQGVKVTWAFNGNTPFPMNALTVFMSMEDMLGSQFEDGLKMLKEHAEAEAAKIPETPTFEVQEIAFEPHQYVTLRKEVAIQELESFYNDNKQPLLDAVAKSGLQVAGPTSGIYYTWDMENMKTDNAIAVPVTGTAKQVEGFEIVDVPASKALLVEYPGPYDNMEAAHLAIEEYMEANGLDEKLTIEEYVIGSKEEADPAKWNTRIIYVLQ